MRCVASTAACTPTKCSSSAADGCCSDTFGCATPAPDGMGSGWSGSYPGPAPGAPSACRRRQPPLHTGVPPQPSCQSVRPSVQGCSHHDTNTRRPIRPSFSSPRFPEQQQQQPTSLAPRLGSWPPPRNALRWGHCHRPPRPCRTRLPLLLAFLALLLLPVLLNPADAGRISSRRDSGRSSRGSSSSRDSSSSSSQLLLPEPSDLRQLQQIAAATGSVGASAAASRSLSEPHHSNTTSITITTTATRTTTSQSYLHGSPYELPGSPEELSTCLNAHQPNATRGTSWTAAMSDAPSYFQVIGMWWSSKVADVPLTITTQLSWNRKWQLKAMCRSWGGPIAAVMHLPVLLPRLTRRADARLSDVSAATLERAVAKVAAFHAKLDAAQPCKLDLMLVAEPYLDGKSLVLYPVNTLRNYARLMARTPLIGLVDVDLIVSSSLRAELLQPGKADAYVREAAAAAAQGRDTEWVEGGGGRREGGGVGKGVVVSTGRSRLEGVSEELAAALNLTKVGKAEEEEEEEEMEAEEEGKNATRGSAVRGRAAWVLPAFATRGGSTSLQVERAEKLAAAGSKAKLRPYYEHGKVLRFDWGSTGHRNTNYGKWFRTTEPYVVQWSDRYEPWVFVDRLGSSWADARFRGYGKNKISHVRSLAYDGYELVVHPAAFLIHRPHLESSSSNAHARAALYGSKKTKSSSMYGHNVYLYKLIALGMAYGNYTPVVDPATAACRQNLSWWTQQHAGAQQQQQPQAT